MAVKPGNHDQPNILWIVSEDNSARYLRLYDPAGAEMPTVESLAEQGLVFNHAFSNAPVCSVARSTLISGSYAPRLGAQYHRANKHVPMPEGLNMFPTYLREVGYYCSNNAKEDYNEIKNKGCWDESSKKATWRNRAPGQPFFHVQNFDETHESKMFFDREAMRESMEILPKVDASALNSYLPDTVLGQFTHDWYLERHRILDVELGLFLQKLKDEGLYEDTIIFYYGDHGGVLPRSKGFLYESGLQVPLVVSVPEKWKHLFPEQAGERIDGFVEFIDFGPTVLNLAGVPVPEGMDGQAFLGAGVELDELNARDETFAYADRFDEKIDLVRSFRKGDWKYIRSYQPFNPDMLFTKYRFKSLLIQEWADLYRAGQLNAMRSLYFEARTPEALFNLQEDPYELNDLSKNSQYAAELQQMRTLLRDKVKSLPDLSFYPESYLIDAAWDNPTAFGQANISEIAALVEIADLNLISFEEAKSGIKAALDSANPWHRYWGVIVCSSFCDAAKGFLPQIKMMSVEDSENLVRVRAAEYIGLTGAGDPVAPLVACFKAASNTAEILLILNTMTVLQDVEGYHFGVSEEMLSKQIRREKGNDVRNRIAYLSAEEGGNSVPF
jgi:arylsulfatase A-like enzyme